MGCFYLTACIEAIPQTPRDSQIKGGENVRAAAGSSHSPVSSDQEEESGDQLNQPSRVSSQFPPPDGSRTVKVPAGNYELRYSFLSQRGYYPEALDKANQDSYCIYTPFGSRPDDHFFGVFDGHGEYGAQCSKFVKRKLCENLLKSSRFPMDAIEACHSAFLATNTQLHSDNLDDSMSGTTAITILVRGRTLNVSNSGDSRAVIAERRGKDIVVVDLSIDQTPFRADELERVKHCGARVLTLDQIEGLKNPDVQCRGTEEGCFLSVTFHQRQRGATQKQIEGEMGVKIILPSSKKDSIVIEGVSLESVIKASEKIQDIIEQAIKSPSLDYSHFVSLPLAIHPALVDKLINFQNCVLGNCSTKQDENLESDSNGDTSEVLEEKDDPLDAERDVAVNLKAEDDSEHVKVEINKIPFVSYPPKASKSFLLTDAGIDKSIFIEPKKFHLTVLMLKLWNKDRVAAAAEVLQRVYPKVLDALDGRPISVRLKGLDCMRGSLAKARVLYAPVEEIGSEDRLRRACRIQIFLKEVIIDAYVEAGLVLEKDAQQKLKLHATVMNARHRKWVRRMLSMNGYSMGNEMFRKTRTKRFDSFDAQGIVRQHGSEEWGEYLIREAHLSQRFVVDDNGYYHCCASIPFPENMQIE